MDAATFGWLCVETVSGGDGNERDKEQPPSGGCVLKPFYSDEGDNMGGSHLRVAVC